MKALNILLKNIGKYGFIFLIKLIFFEIFNLYRLRYYDYFIKNPNNKKFQPYIPSPYYNLKFIKNYIEKGSIFIDFGCGTGRVLNYFKKQNLY
jgi:SAM-dependent methyltransferase